MMSQADVNFAVRFARFAGDHMKAVRATVKHRNKADKTPVSDADTYINEQFIEAVKATYATRGSDVSVHGEESSALVRGARMMWVIDPIDGTEEYLDNRIVDSQCSACVGIALMQDDQPELSVVYNPFQDELFVTSSELPPQRNGRLLNPKGMASGQQFTRGIKYDYSYWDGAAYDLPALGKKLGGRIGKGSAISQACDVATGKSSFAVFPGNKIHDIAPGALLVSKLGGVVGDMHGRKLNWNDLSYGVVYAADSTTYHNVVDFFSR